MDEQGMLRFAERLKSSDSQEVGVYPAQDRDGRNVVEQASQKFPTKPENVDHDVTVGQNRDNGNYADGPVAQSEHQTPWYWSNDHQSYYRAHLNQGNWTYEWCLPSSESVPSLTPNNAIGLVVENKLASTLSATDHPFGDAKEQSESQFQARHMGAELGTSKPTQSEYMSHGTVYEHHADRQVVETLDPRFMLRRNNFYKFGRVFKVLWPEAAGPSIQSTAISHGFAFQGKFGEFVLAKIRWFIVIKEGLTSCVALPIQTYAGQATAKPYVKSSDHAIIHTATGPPDPLSPEGPMLHPIRVVASSPGTSMDSRSRLNYAKPYTVEHNLKVYDVGQVSKDHEGLLLGSFLHVWGLRRPVLRSDDSWSGIQPQWPIKAKSYHTITHKTNDDEDESEEDKDDVDEDEYEDDDDDVDVEEEIGGEKSARGEYVMEGHTDLIEQLQHLRQGRDHV